MPAANANYPEAASPDRNRRRIWTRPTVTSHAFLVLTPDQLYLAPEAGEPNPELLAVIQDGADLNDTLGQQTVVVDLVTVRHVKLDLLTNSILVEYTAGGRAAEERLTFATPEAADACFSKVWRRLGEGLRLVPYERDTWALCRGPLLLLLGALLATGALTLVLSVIADMGPGERPAAAALVGWLDWRLVCAVGGMFAAASQVWLFRRLTTPPAALELTRGGVRPTSAGVG
jgi:hypothetical protein